MVKFSQGGSKAWHDTQKKLQGAATSRDDANYMFTGPDSVCFHSTDFSLLCGTQERLPDSEFLTWDGEIQSVFSRRLGLTHRKIPQGAGTSRKDENNIFSGPDFYDAYCTPQPSIFPQMVSL